MKPLIYHFINICLVLPSLKTKGFLSSVPIAEGLLWLIVETLLTNLFIINTKMAYLAQIQSKI